MEASNEIIKNVSHPSHYADGREYEPKDVIRDWGLNFNLGSAIKYISRAGKKDWNPITQDLMKAKQYIEFEIEALNKEIIDDKNNESREKKLEDEEARLNLISKMVEPLVFDILNKNLPEEIFGTEGSQKISITEALYAIRCVMYKLRELRDI